MFTNNNSVKFYEKEKKENECPDGRIIFLSLFYHLIEID
jgi:hypothetical protein